MPEVQSSDRNAMWIYVQLDSLDFATATYRNEQTEAEARIPRGVFESQGKPIEIKIVIDIGAANG